ncbi:MAG: hypothetical protein P8Y30_05200, partial [candidate division WOR-3 bacterium]
MKLKQNLHDFLKKEIGEERDLNPPPYPGELLLTYGFKDKKPLVLLTDEDPLKIASDAEFFFKRVFLLTEENSNQAGTVIAAKDFDLLILEAKNLELKIPEQGAIDLSVGDNISLEDFLLSLEEGSLIRRNRVYEEGEYVNRGGITDIWTLNNKNPVRIELEDDKIASLRFFDPSNQLSIEKA